MLRLWGALGRGQWKSTGADYLQSRPSAVRFTHFATGSRMMGVKYISPLICKKLRDYAKMMYTMEGRTALRDAADLIEQQARRITELKRGIGNAMQRANETGMGSLAFQDTVFTMHAMLAAALAEPAAQEVSRQSAIIDGASGHHAVEPPASAASASEGWVAVSERLPAIGQVVWLCDADNIYMGGRGQDGDEWLWCQCYNVPNWEAEEWVPDDLESDDDYQPTHWMPLPSMGAAPEAANPSDEEVK